MGSKAHGAWAGIVFKPRKERMESQTMKIKDFVQAMNLKLRPGDEYKLRVEFDSAHMSRYEGKLQWSLELRKDRSSTHKHVYGPFDSAEELLEQVTDREILRNIESLEADVD